MTLLLFIFFLFNDSHAQVANSSFFKETKAVNPAVISMRPAAVFSILGKFDDIKKEQDLSNETSEINSTIDINLTAGSFFYGGKGGWLTSEFLLEYGSGTKKIELNSTTEDTDSDDSVSSLYLNWGLGLGHFLGLSFGLLRYKYSSNMQASFAGETIDLGYDSESLVKIIRAGTRLGKVITLGLFGEILLSSIKFQDGTDSGTESSVYPKIGGGIGYKGKLSHLELSYERSLTPDKIGEKKYTASRIMGIIEITLGKLRLGYIGKYNLDGYMDAEGLLYNSLVYSNAYEEPRLEHGINFAIGSDKGHSLSGSLFYSKINSQEVNDIYGGTDQIKYPTTTTSYSASIKYAYAF